MPIHGNHNLMGETYSIARQGGISKFFNVKAELGILLWTSGQTFLRTLGNNLYEFQKIKEIKECKAQESVG
jgi:hypothetical protein